MLPILDKIFESKTKKASKTINDVKDIVMIQNNIAERTKELNDIEYRMLLEKKNEFFISLKDFVELMNADDISIDTILKKCEHVSDITGVSSIVEMHAIIENDHITLCPDHSKCDLHKNKTAQKLRISTIRGVR